MVRIDLNNGGHLRRDDGPFDQFPQPQDEQPSRHKKPSEMERVIYRNDDRIHQIKDFRNPADEILDEQVFEIDQQLKAGEALDADFSETMKCFSFSLQKNESDTS